MLVTVMSGSLEVLVYSEDQLPYLRPVYGNMPCSPPPSSARDQPRDQPVDYGDLDMGIPLPRSSGEDGGPWEERDGGDMAAASTGVDGEMSFETDGEQQRGGKQQGDTTPHLADDAGPELRDAGGGKTSDVRWPHEARYCATPWVGEKDSSDGSPGTITDPPRWVRMPRVARVKKSTCTCNSYPSTVNHAHSICTQSLMVVSVHFLTLRRRRAWQFAAEGLAIFDVERYIWHMPGTASSPLM